MAFASTWDLFTDQAQQAASVLTLSFSGINVHEAPKEEGYFKGNFIGETKKPRSFLDKPISLYFCTGSRMRKLSATSICFRPRPVEWLHAQLAPKVWDRLPNLFPVIHSKLQERRDEFRDEEAMKQALERPCVIFNSGETESNKWNEWVFEVVESSSQLAHIITFRDFEIIDCSTVG